MFSNPNAAFHDANGIVVMTIQFFGDEFALVALKGVCG